METKVKNLKLVAPQIDKLLLYFGNGHLNPSAPSPAVAEAMNLLFKALARLAPLKENDEAKSIWLQVPRGEISDYDSYQELLEQEAVSNYEEYEKLWLTEYPDKVKWYRLALVEGYDNKGNIYFRSVGVNKKTIISASFVRGAGSENWKDEAVVELCGLLTIAACKSMELLDAGVYNGIVDSLLPYQFRVGIVKRSAVWSAAPELKKSLFEGMTETFFERFQELVRSGENDVSKIVPLKAMSGNDFLRACAIGYKACGYSGTDLALADQYILHADGRDEGLTGKGDIMHRGDGGIDLDSSDAWDAWYHHRKHMGGHPWEVCRGGNSTHIDLFVCDSRSDLDWQLKLGKITDTEAEEKRKNGGYYFCVAGDAWNRAVEAVKFYVSIHDAGFPVLFRDADHILSRFLGEDLVGIVPHDTIPVYCDSMFPKHYGKILDFMHVYDDDGWLGDVEWLPEIEAELA